MTLANPSHSVASFPSPAETQAEFRAVCDRLREGDNPFFGTAEVSKLQQQLQGIDLEPQVEAEVRIKLTTHLILLGRFAEAVAMIEAIDAQHLVDLSGSHLLLQAIAQLQLAEDQNCIERHAVTSCILPIRPEAVHRLPEPSRQAGDLYQEYLGKHPGDYQVKWLLNLSRMLSGDFPAGVPSQHRLPATSLEPQGDLPMWYDIAPTLQVDAHDLAGGAILDDFDGDGLLDLVSSSWDPCEPLKAFRNDGRGGFEDVSGRWGLDSQLGGLNLMHADFDNDGLLDLLVLRGAWMGQDGRIRNSLLRNDLERPAGRFVDVTAAAGLAYPTYPTQAAAWADFDGDGDLDLYVGNEANKATLMTYGRTGTPYPSQLFRNNSDGTFTDVARLYGVANHRYTKGVAWGDFDNDRDPDLYVSTFDDNRLYRNDGADGFVDVAAEMGVTEPHEASFATWFFDYDNDGDLDIFAADYSAQTPDVLAAYFGTAPPGGRPRIHRNDDHRFTELSSEIGFDRPVLPMGANYGDLDNDGFPDFYLGTGVPDFDALMPNIMYRNDGGRRFQDVTFIGGFGHLQKGHGIAFGDLDNDGDQDLFQQLGGAYPFDRYGNALYENPGSEHAWIVLRLVGRRANRFALGARIHVQGNGPAGEQSFHSVVGSGGSFGGSSLQQELGLGPTSRIDTITILWPGSGTRQVFSGPLDVNHFYQAVEGEPELQILHPKTFRLTPSPTGDHTNNHSGRSKR